jgi:prevent-host-death family protein
MYLSDNRLIAITELIHRLPEARKNYYIYGVLADRVDESLHAKIHFSKLINRALKGEEIIISRSGEPLIRLVPYSREESVRRSGQLKGLMKISDDFDAPLPGDMIKLFYGDEK